MQQRCQQLLGATWCATLDVVWPHSGSRPGENSWDGMLLVAPCYLIRFWISRMKSCDFFSHLPHRAVVNLLMKADVSHIKSCSLQAQGLLLIIPFSIHSYWPQQTLGQLLGPSSMPQSAV